jgi:hypothetical protein
MLWNHLQSSNAIVIAPFWTDINIENGGELYFRSSDDSNLLQEVGVVIGEGDGSDFLPITLFIATWYRVAPYMRPQEDVVSVTIQVCICAWLAVKQVAVAVKHISKPRTLTPQNLHVDDAAYTLCNKIQIFTQ